MVGRPVKDADLVHTRDEVRQIMMNCEFENYSRRYFFQHLKRLTFLISWTVFHCLESTGLHCTYLSIQSFENQHREELNRLDNSLHLVLYFEHKSSMEKLNVV